jgi:hypothetical protein
MGSLLSKNSLELFQCGKLTLKICFHCFTCSPKRIHDPSLYTVWGSLLHLQNAIMEELCFDPDIDLLS